MSSTISILSIFSTRQWKATVTIVINVYCSKCEFFSYMSELCCSHLYWLCYSLQTYVTYLIIGWYWKRMRNVFLSPEAFFTWHGIIVGSNSKLSCKLIRPSSPVRVTWLYLQGYWVCPCVIVLHYFHTPSILRVRAVVYPNSTHHIYSWLKPTWLKIRLTDTCARAYVLLVTDDKSSCARDINKLI